MPEPTEYHREERLVQGPIPTSFSHAYIAAYDQPEIASIQIVGGQKVETAMSLPYLLTPECKEETYAVPHPKGTSLRQAVDINFHSIHM